MKAHIFLIANLKFRLQTPCSFGDMAENVKLIGIPINNFWCIYIIASSPGLHTLFCLWRVNKKLPQGETSQNTFQRSWSISWKCKMHMVKWAHPSLKLLISAQKIFELNQLIWVSPMVLKIARSKFPLPLPHPNSENLSAWNSLGQGTCC